MNIKGSQTEINLLASFAGESQARNRYDYFAAQAKKEGYVQISQIFEETALQEKEHAKRFFKFLEGGDLVINCPFPAGIIGTTLENLQESAAGEKHEWDELYPEFSRIARAEGFEIIASVWDHICVSEQYHEKRYLELAGNIIADRVFKRDKPVFWRCRNCGYVHEGESAVEVCPACAHPRAYFELWAHNW